MWKLISEVSRDRSVLLTTHSMEEAEALCTRAGIMSQGELLCLGTVQHLKTRYLDGYTIDCLATPDASEDDIERLTEEIVENSLPGSSVTERHGRFLRLDVPSLSSIGIGSMFAQLQNLKRDFCLESYSISQCTLEQVFIKLVEDGAKDQ